MSPEPNNTWPVGNVRGSRRHGVSRVSADVRGEEVWIESRDADISPRPEAIASAFLLPALHLNATLNFDQPLSRQWMRNAERLCQVFHSWWDYPAANPVHSPSLHDSSGGGTSTASCFSGGADSFHTLLAAPYRIDVLVFVQGFDVPLEDTQRMDACDASLRRVAEASGKRAIVLRTNLRSHTCFAAAPWKFSHGGALAAMGHVLSDQVGTWIIPASYSYGDTPRWGSHWLTDPYYSSDALRIIHWGAERRKIERLAVIADSPLVRNELRVCWKNLAPTGNCSACEKCVRTMLYLEANGKLQGFRTFDLSVPLSQRIDGIDEIKPAQHNAWNRLLETALAEDVKDAIRRILERSPAGSDTEEIDRRRFLALDP